MIISEVPCVAAGTFTTNIVKAAPVKWDQEVVYNHPYAQAVVCNSGVANACTGAECYGYCMQTAEKAADVLGIDKMSVLVASTGVIGQQIPIDKIKAGEHYDFVEVMACPGGCINGGGQPIVDANTRATTDFKALRASALYSEDEKATIRKSHENPVIKQLYDDFLGEPCGHKSHELLHTHYTDKSANK